MWLPIESEIVKVAAAAYSTLPETVFLSSADSLHLVTAIHNGFNEILTYDLHQSAAAAFLGLKALKA